jgi:amino acid transporter
MQGIYTYISETNNVPMGYNVTAILSLLFMVPIPLAAALALMYFYISTFRSMCAVLNMAVFFRTLTSWFPGMVLTYFLNDFEMVPVAPIITGISLVFTFHIRSISIVLLLLLLLLLLF